MPHDENGPPPGAAHKCPICRKPAAHAYRPFCSKRCADIDLGRWVSGSYVIPGGSDDADEDGAEAPTATENGSGEA